MSKRIQHGNPYQESKYSHQYYTHKERYTEIEYENKKLLSKLSDIMRSPSNTFSPTRKP